MLSFAASASAKEQMEHNVWCYEQVCLAKMFKFSTNVIGKLAYSTCYKLAADY